MTNPRQQVRVVGGQWRRRVLHFPDIAGIRPTPSRVRETLFNWLMFDLQGVACLDMFAGSGVLGIEALSRGATNAVFLDSHKEVCAYLHQQLRTLGCENAQIHWAQFPTSMPDLSAYQFDLVFIDPPYDAQLVEPSCQWVVDRGLLANQAWVYVEWSRHHAAPQWPAGWTIYRETATRHVNCALLRACRS